jgi:hypothetical protein
VPTKRLTRTAHAADHGKSAMMRRKTIVRKQRTLRRIVGSDD